MLKMMMLLMLTVLMMTTHHLKQLQVLDSIAPEHFSFVSKVLSSSSSSNSSISPPEPVSCDVYAAADFTQIARWCRSFPSASLVRQAGVSTPLSR